jgi:hypothetical protein
MRKFLAFFLMISFLTACCLRCSKTAGVVGSDRNGNGVRDEVEEWIQTKFPPGDKLESAMDVARAFQTECENPETADLQEGIDALHCLFDVHNFSTDDFIQELKGRTVNTLSRSIGFLKYNSRLSGKMLMGTGKCRFTTEKNKK